MLFEIDLFYFTEAAFGNKPFKQLWHGLPTKAYPQIFLYLFLEIKWKNRQLKISRRCLTATGLPDFSWYNIPKWEN
jgi:hypothetical protein